MVWEREHGHTVALVLVRAPTRAGAVASRAASTSVTPPCGAYTSYPGPPVPVVASSRPNTMHRCDMSTVLLEGHFIPFASWQVPSLSLSLSLSLSFFHVAHPVRDLRGAHHRTLSEKQPAHPVGGTGCCILTHCSVEALVTSSCPQRVDMASWQLRRPWRRQEYSVQRTIHPPSTRARAAAVCEPPLTPKRPL